jgi:hypothetical protein
VPGAYWRRSVMTSDCGVPWGQFLALKPGPVHIRVSDPTSPETTPIPVQPEGPSNDISPENDPTSVKPLMAPAHSRGSVAHAPSTQLIALWNAWSEMVRVEKLDDSSVPDQLPARFATPGGVGVGLGGVGMGGVDTDPLPPQLKFTSAPRSKTEVASAIRRLVVSDFFCGRSEAADGLRIETHVSISLSAD